MATAAASVTTARLTPRTRRAGTAMTNPTSAATSAGHDRAEREGPVAEVLRQREAAVPANATWASEIWPTNPVSTTSDRAITAKTRVLMIAWRQSKPRRNSPTSVAARSASDREGRHVAGRGANGRRPPPIVPRSGRLLPRTNMAMTITMNGSDLASPAAGIDSAGNQFLAL